MAEETIDEATGEIDIKSPVPPSSVLDRYDVPEETRERIQTVADYDLSFLTDGFNEELIRKGKPFAVEQVYPLRDHFGKVDQEIAELLESEFKRYVVLTLIDPETPHAVPGPVDMYWHRFILYTAKYKEFCEEVWGSFEGQPGYRHHYPANPETRKGHVQAFQNTFETYLDIFGESGSYTQASGEELPVWYSDLTGTCGDSYSGTSAGQEQFEDI